ncbi:hypothetical protein D9758_014951 [Tetrapyrgos nigripes]|uniref:Uncharacterized protein n=1 Tax=Tetrapyrgos nigripes TaxID=182062 RepID=A0A8H5CJL4_9AGAR|nr:hypothetical protein D9758_014951 [Tetrapyrgos nigripes]
MGQSLLDSFSKRIRTLFLIAASNFVLPVIFVILELILMSTPLTNGYIVLAAINISATNVEILGVIFATIWASQDDWKKDEEKELTGVTAPISFATFVSTRLTEGSDYHLEGFTTQGGTTTIPEEGEL